MLPDAESHHPRLVSIHTSIFGLNPSQRLPLLYTGRFQEPGSHLQNPDLICFKDLRGRYSHLLQLPVIQERSKRCLICFKCIKLSVEMSIYKKKWKMEKNLYCLCSDVVVLWLKVMMTTKT